VVVQFFRIFSFTASLMFCMPTQVYAKIIVKTNQIQFVNEQGAQAKQENAEAVRFKHFNKFEELLSHKNCSKAPFSIDGKGTYASLIPFSEYLEKADFKVAPDKKYAVVFSARCERACATAENPWKCTMYATVLDENGYVLGDMEGDFLDIELRADRSEIILLRSSAGSETRYAEVYDLYGKLKNKIDDYPQP
jgi:hypothetical protein